MMVAVVNSTCCFVFNLTDKFMETSFDDEIDSRQSRRTRDSPVRQVERKRAPLNLPDWQTSSATEHTEESPTMEVTQSDLLWPPVVMNEYTDQQPVTESPVCAQQKSDILSQPINWEHLDKPVPSAPPASFPSVTKQILEGDVYETEEQNETNEMAEHGSDCHVRRLVKTRRQLLPVTELTLEDGVEVSRTTSDAVVAVHVEEFVNILPLGVDDPHAAGLETETSVEESDEPLEAGVTLTRRVTTTTIRRLQAPEISWKPEDWQQHHPADVEVIQDGKNKVSD